MRSLSTVWLLLCGFTLGAVGCDGGGGESAPKSVAAQLCERARTCNALEGMSVAECTEDIQVCENRLSSSAKADWEDYMVGCLELQACQNFLGCYAAWGIDSWCQ